MKTIMLGLLALSAGIALLVLSNGPSIPFGPSVQAGDFTPTPDPTTDPCDDFKKVPPTCTAAPTQPPRSEGDDDTPTATATAVVTEVPDDPDPTNTAQPAATSPSGGAGAGGVSPPDTGQGATSSGVSVPWYAALGAAMAVLGVAMVSYGARRRR